MPPSRRDSPLPFAFPAPTGRLRYFGTHHGSIGRTLLLITVLLLELGILAWAVVSTGNWEDQQSTANHIVRFDPSHQFEPAAH